MPKLRVSTLLVAVAAGALLFGAERLLRRRSIFRDGAEQQAKLEAWFRSYDQNTAAFYGHLRAKYERAASCPWLGIEPDTPPPDQDVGQWEEELDPGWTEVQRAIYLTV